MGIYQDNAIHYYERGLIPVPIEPGKKSPLIEDLGEHFYDRALSESDFEKVQKKLGGWDLGLALGPHSQVVAVDFDFVSKKASIVEGLLKSNLPNDGSIVMKSGAKGWTMFFRYDPSGYAQCRYSVKSEGELICDILLSRSVTVLPPSKHLKAPTGRYEWITPDTLLDVTPDELPTLSQHHIDDLLLMIENALSIEESLNEFIRSEASHRFPNIVKCIFKESDSASSLDELVLRVKSYDLEKHSSDPRGPVHLDKSYLKKQSSDEFLTDLASRLCEWKKKKKMESGVIWELGSKFNSFWKPGPRGQMKMATDYKSFAQWFKMVHPDARKCMITNKVKIKLPHLDGWQSSLNSIEALKSLATDYGISDRHVKIHLHRLIQEMTPQSLVDIPQWDKKDRFQILSWHLSSDYFTSHEICEIFKEWGSNVFIKMINPTHQNRCLILKGPQGLGKDTLVRNLFGAFKPYYSQVNPSQKDTDFIVDVCKYVIVHIEEFDQTNNKSVAMLKSVITQPKQTLRKAYGLDHEDYDSRFSWISTANPDDLFRDTTGNRRYIVLPLTKIDFNYPKNESLQFLAQMKHMAENEAFFVSKDTEMKIRALIDGMTPDMIEPEIIQMWKDRAELFRSPVFDSIEKNEFKDGALGIGGEKAARIIKEIADFFGISTKKVRSTLKSEGLSRKNSRVFYLLENRQQSSDQNKQEMRFLT